MLVSVITPPAFAASMNRCYRLLDCWVSIGEEGGAAAWISITVTDPRFVLPGTSIGSPTEKRRRHADRENPTAGNPIRELSDS